MSSLRLRRLKENIQLHGDEDGHEQVDSWSNRDLIPLPPSRRTWGWFHYFGYWTLNSLNISNWQTPNTFLCKMFLVVGWNGGRLVAVCITAIWPSFAKMHNTLPSSMPTTTYQFIGFVLFWILSVPFLMMIWSLSVAKGVGPLWTTGQHIPETSSWNLHWLEMKGINQIIGGIAAGITNGSDFSRYARSPKSYVLGTVLSAWVTGVLVSLVGLVVTAACQKIYGEVYWNPPDLLMRMMDSGEGSSKARAGVFFLAAGFALTGMFENVCGNAVAGGIDLAGLFPRYLDIRRGAILTFLAVWVCQPWQLVNKAATFVSVLSSFSVFLSPIMGVMVVDFYLLRKGRIQLSHLYRTKDTAYWIFRDYDQVDVYETFTPREAAALGVVPVAEPQVLDGVELGPDDKKMEPGSIVEKFL
ncbi:NCS1 nucleoside transporter family protein-like protein [Aureobasidium sp. EXF-3400]|nr:NCS1 nucleoside transporter family protein-like protein [Aureobasidium sp. EXF-3400]